MKRLLLIALILLAIPSFALAGMVIQTVAGGEAGVNFYDDFGTDPLGTRWVNLSGSGENYDDVNDNWDFTLSSAYLYDTQTTTTNQWAIVERVTTVGEGYPGIYFRSTNNASECAYVVRAVGITGFIWRDCKGHSCDDISSLWSRVIAYGDYFGITVEGTGDSTIVTVYDFGATTPDSCASAAACDPDTLTWDDYDEAKNAFTDNPGQAGGDCDSELADTGKYMGLYFGSNNDSTFDDFFFGDWIP